MPEPMSSIFLKQFKNNRILIGNEISKPLNLESGVQQGGILSPMIFTIYGAGLKEWVEHSSIFDCSKENDKKKHKGVKKFDKKRQVQ